MDAVYSKPGYLFRRMQQIAVAIFVEECKAFDLTPVQYAALVAIRRHPGIDATRLSAVIAFDRSTLGSVIARLEGKRLVARKASREDKRTKLLYLTEAGEALLRDIVPSVDRAQARMLQPLKGRRLQQVRPGRQQKHKQKHRDRRRPAPLARLGLLLHQKRT